VFVVAGGNMTATLVLWLGSTAFHHSLLQNIRWEYSDFSFLLPKADGKFVYIHAMKISRGNTGVVPLSLNFGSRWK
jgi:hypothetical protein